MKMKTRRLPAAILLLLALCLAGFFQNTGPQGELYPVVRFVDGDTVILDMDGEEERVRLIGVDAPESVHPDESRNVPYGKITSEFAKEELEGKRVAVEYDVQKRDQYGRILAYVYVGERMFNEVLLEEGHGKVVTYPPNVKYTDRFTAMQEQAREERKGVWAYDEL